MEPVGSERGDCADLEAAGVGGCGRRRTDRCEDAPQVMTACLQTFGAGQQLQATLSGGGRAFSASHDANEARNGRRL